MKKPSIMYFGTFFLALNIALCFGMPNSALAIKQSIYSQAFLQQIQASGKVSIPEGKVVVAVVDQGIYFNHPDLSKSLWTDENGNHGWNFISNSSNLTPHGSHGTEIAGIIKATAPQKNIELMSLIVCDQNDGCEVEHINKAIIYAADHGANIINLSIGLVGNDSFSHNFDYAISYAYKKGAVIVAAAGNQPNAKNLSLRPVSPICNDNGQDMVLGVSSVDNNNKMPAWANFGDCVDVLAPGNNIYTAAYPKFHNNQLYTTGSGTSYSTAEVSGLAALLKLQSPSLTNWEIMDIIKKTAGNKPADGSNFGVINFSSALASAEIKAILQPAAYVSSNTARNKTLAKAKIQFIIKPRG